MRNRRVMTCTTGLRAGRRWTCACGRRRTSRTCKTVLGGALAARGMPVFEMADDTAEALRAYLVNLAWDAHEAQDGAPGD